MLFDFDTFAKLVERCYEPGPYSLEEVLFIFKYYFWRYEQEFGRPHPHIRMQQIRTIIERMPYVERDDFGGYFADIDAEEYRYIIEQHFRTSYKNCDYNINHFFSGRIRELRFYETCY